MSESIVVQESDRSIKNRGEWSFTEMKSPKKKDFQIHGFSSYTALGKSSNKDQNT